MWLYPLHVLLLKQNWTSTVELLYKVRVGGFIFRLSAHDLNKPPRWWQVRGGWGWREESNPELNEVEKGCDWFVGELREICSSVEYVELIHPLALCHVTTYNDSRVETLFCCVNTNCVPGYITIVPENIYFLDVKLTSLIPCPHHSDVPVPLQQPIHDHGSCISLTCRKSYINTFSFR